jgi:hypothetical protein
MIHARRRIVLAVKSRLEGLVADGLVTAVLAGRADPVSSADRPVLLVYARQEQAAPMSAGRGGPTRRIERQLLLSVEGVTSVATDDDAAADALALAVEAALANDETLGGVARDLVLSSTAIEVQTEGETRTSRVRLEFTVTYHTAAGDPGTSI